MTPTEVNYPSSEGAECPFPVYRYWREEAPVFQLPDRPNVFVVSRYDDVRTAARDTATFSNVGSRTSLNGFGFVGESTTGHTILESDPPDHKAKHDLAFKALKPGRIREHAGWIQEIVDELIDQFIDSGECEFVGDFARRLPVAVTAQFFGIGREDLPLLEGWADLEVSGLSWMPQEQQDRQRRNSLKMGVYLQELITAREADPGDDFVSQLIVHQAERDGKTDSDEILAIASNVLAGGAATTQHMLGGAFLLLLEHPDEMHRCRLDPSRLPRILNEAMRLESSVQWVPRVVTCDTELAGVAIPQGSYLLIAFASANRDPDRFTDPDNFDPERTNAGDQIAFGTGIHSCIGAPLARLEGRIALERLLARLSNVKVATGHEIRHVASPSFRGLAALPLTFTTATLT